MGARLTLELDYGVEVGKTGGMFSWSFLLDLGSTIHMHIYEMVVSPSNS